MTRDALRAQALDLPVAERRALALELLESTEEAQQDIELDPTVEASHIAEVERRWRDIDAGEARLVAWAEVEAELLAED